MNNTNIGTDKNNTCDKTVIARCLDGLDYSLQTAQERIELVNKLLGQSDEYFLNLCDQDKRDESIKKKPIVNKDKYNNIIGIELDENKYINLLPTSKQLLSHDIYECKVLERMADYILFSPDLPKMNKQQEYSFYNENNFKKLIKKEKLYEDIINKCQKNDEGSDLNREEILDIIGDNGVFTGKNHFSIQRINKAKYINKDKKMAFLKRKENYKLDGKSRITKLDLKDKELEYVKELEKQIIKIQNSIKKGKLDGQRYLANDIIRSLRDAQIQYKNYKKGTIVFKKPLKDDGRVDYGEFDFFDKNHVLALLNMPKRQVCDEDLPLLIYDLEVLMENIKIREEDKEIVELYQSGFSQQEIANELKITQQSINQVLNKLANNVIKEYELVYEDWYYLNKVKGKYKKCSRCGEIKLVNKFRKRSDNKGDGMYNQCKICENSVK